LRDTPARRESVEVSQVQLEIGPYTVTDDGKFRTAPLANQPEVTLIWRWLRQQWRRWTVLAPSCGMEARGVAGCGLYAWRSDAKDWVVGNYTGINNIFEDETLAEKFANELAYDQGRSYILKLPVDGGWWVIDGEHAGPPYLQEAVDYRGTGMIPTAWLKKGTTQLVVGEGTGEYDNRLPWHKNQLAEITWFYGDDFNVGLGS